MQTIGVGVECAAIVTSDLRGLPLAGYAQVTRLKTTGTREMRLSMVSVIDSLDCREWWYYPVVMPLVGGNGPASVLEAEEITYEVWDKLLNTHGSYDNLYCAINEAMRLNNG